jgi:hypothetical protein
VNPVEPAKSVALDQEAGRTQHVLVETNPQIAGPVSFELLAGLRVVDGGQVTVAMPAGQSRIRFCVRTSWRTVGTSTWAWTSTVLWSTSSLAADRAPVGLTAGMAVTVEIKTERRRVIEFFLSPVLRDASESIRER